LILVSSLAYTLESTSKLSKKHVTTIIIFGRNPYCFIKLGCTALGHLITVSAY